jgi:hypothetical protein
MAKTKEISFSIGRKVQLPNFGNITFHEGETIELEPGDDPTQQWNELRGRIHSRYQDTLRGLVAPLLPPAQS